MTLRIKLHRYLNAIKILGFNIVIYILHYRPSQHGIVLHASSCDRQDTHISEIHVYATNNNVKVLHCKICLDRKHVTQTYSALKLSSFW